MTARAGKRTCVMTRAGGGLAVPRRPHRELARRQTEIPRLTKKQ
jgi:hypothetical protein